MQKKLHQDDIQYQIYLKISKVLNQFISYKDYIDLNLSTPRAKYLETQIIHKLYSDLLSFVERDPASNGSANIILQAYKSFEAVVYYRIANEIRYCNDLTYESRHRLARKISEYAKYQTGIEINPGAKIGNGFVIDHGTGTVIGETTEIGNNCYILQGVILGARGIANNPKGKRHPCIGNNVEIGAFSRVLGPVNIGNNVMIAPCAVVLNDIPSNQKVIIKNQIQLIKNNNIFSNINVYALVPKEDSVFVIYGENLENSHIIAVDEYYIPIENIKISIQIRTNKYLAFKIEYQRSSDMEIGNSINLQIMIDENESIYLINNPFLNSIYTNYTNVQYVQNN